MHAFPPTLSYIAASPRAHSAFFHTSLHVIGVCSWTRTCTPSFLPTCSWICRPVIIRQPASYIRSYPFCATSYPSPSSERTLSRFFLLVHQSYHFFSLSLLLPLSLFFGICTVLILASLSSRLVFTCLYIHTSTLTPPSSETRALSLLFLLELAVVLR